jgi:HSP20 family protein
MANKTLDVYNRKNAWNPMREISSLHRGIDRLFDDFFNLSPVSGQTPQSLMREIGFSPAMDVEEREDHYLLSVDLPGVKKDDVKITLNNNQLTISGERNEEHVEDKKNKHWVERSYGRFERSLSLPSNVKFEDIEADFRDGVLKVAIPKAQTATERTVEIGGKKGGGFLTRMFVSKQEEQTGKKAAG